MVNWSEVIIFVQPQTKEEFEKRFKIAEQEIVILDVEDRISVLAPWKKSISPEEWTRIQKEKVYPKLKKQIDKYLPFKE